MDSQSSNEVTQAGALNTGNVVIDIKPVQVSTEADNAAEVPTSEVAPPPQQAPVSTEKLGTNTTWLVLHWNYVWILCLQILLNIQSYGTTTIVFLNSFSQSKKQNLVAYATERLKMNLLKFILMDVFLCVTSIPTYMANGFAYTGQNDEELFSIYMLKLLDFHRMIWIGFLVIFLVSAIPLLTGSMRYKRGTILGAVNVISIPMLFWFGWISYKANLVLVIPTPVTQIVQIALGVVVTGTSCVGLFMNGRPVAAKLLPYYYVREPESTAA